MNTVFTVPSWMRKPFCAIRKESVLRTTSAANLHTIPANGCRQEPRHWILISTKSTIILYKNARTGELKGGLTQGFIRSKTDLFPQYCKKMPRQVSALPRHFILSWEKSHALERSAVLNRRFFFTAVTGDRVNTGCIPRETGAVVEEKIHSKPCKSLCESAQCFSFFRSYLPR